MNFDSIDLPILRFLTSFVGKSLLFDHLVHAVSRYDTFKGVVMMSLLWFAWFVRPAGGSLGATGIDDEAARRVRLMLVLAGSVATVVLSRVLQLVFHIHQRPILANLGLNFPPFMDAGSVNHWNSFPSDHSMLFFSLSTGLWMVDRRLGWLGFFWSAVVIDLPRVYLGIHYPSDVFAGAILGVLCMVGFLALPLRELAERALAWGNQHRALFYWIAFMVTEQVAHLFDDFRKLGFTLLGHVEG
ncbi:undecaprenyl-diphosphatase [Aliidongia dinghuensis]|uniref:Undecaprenyl-diphosphatase n=1 Tax=Aliidongia dinghuensis TaxID=1867774 RepID=A0A8J2YVJ5_9PROT|nr:phosphatase PAP2 family protein [Aliidongia dinghuensis]GGF28278.1 undecaprenyl-diphosphatase [Aliidongia dinghuensis]